jgi:predicted CxxxxCH...CXXCH cytochrome family protein
VCAQCHPDTIRPDGTINLGGGRHINGVIDLVGGTAGCTACHGDATRLPAENAPAPPRDARGNVATTAPGVGAHQRHLNGGSLRNGLACAECHVVPGTGPSGPDLTHVNGRADLTFAALAQTNGVTPTFDATNHTCTNYCHGASLSAGANRVTWNATGQALCGSCHGLPPASPHPAVTGGVTACGICHPGTVRSDGTIDTAGGKHINGSPDVVGTSCTACHGDASRGGVAGIAPPRDVAGNTATTAPGVGAHQAHLNAGPLSAPVACSECHTVPTDIAHAGQPLNLTWGTIATTGGAVPAYDAVAHTCTNYCHGSNGALQGGTLTTPNWTAGASQVACGSCHGLPPTTGRHVIPQHTGFSCSVCHGAAYTATSVDAARHVNGARDAGGADSALLTWVPETRTCTALCHGDPRVWAPVP